MNRISQSHTKVSKYADFRLGRSTNIQYNSKIIIKEAAETDSATETLQGQKTP